MRRVDPQAFFAFPRRQLPYFLMAVILREYERDIISQELSFDEIYVLLQGLEGKVPVNLVYDADVLFMEFSRMAALENRLFVFEDASLLD